MYLDYLYLTFNVITSIPKIYLLLLCSTITMNYSIVAIALLIVASGAALITSSSLFTKVRERRKDFEKLRE